MIFNPAWALNALTSALVWRMISSIGRSNWKFTGLTLNLALASASGLMSCCFMRLLVLVCFSFHRRACLLGSQTTNRFFNYSRDIPDTDECLTNACSPLGRAGGGLVHAEFQIPRPTKRLLGDNSATTSGFVPRLVEKQLAESFITRLSSQEQVWSDGFEEPE